MYKLNKFFKKLFSKTFFILLIALIAVTAYLYPQWYVRQFHKAEGMYWVWQGDRALRHEKLQDAIDCYNHGLELYPNHYGAWFNLGNIYVVYEDYYSAASAYEKAIEYNPKYTVARMNLGIISEEKLGDFDGAINQYKLIINTKKYVWFIPFVFSNRMSERTNRGIAYYNMGVAYRRKAIYLPENRRKEFHGCMRNAELAYKNAARILKKDYDARYNLALTQHLLSDYKQAGLNYCKAIGLQPMNYEAHYNLAILLRRMKRFEDSRIELEKASMLLSEGHGSVNQSRYVFDVLNDVSASVLMNKNYEHLVEKIDDEAITPQTQLTSIEGRIVASDALDKAMLGNFKSCSSFTIFDSLDD